MIPLLSIIALIYEPIGPITDEPFIYGVDQLEVIEFIDHEPSIEELDMEIKKTQQRILELQKQECNE